MYSSYSDRHWAVVQVYCRHKSSHAVLQEDGGQWVVGRILEGAALEDKTVYQQMYQEMIQYNGK